MPEKHYFVYILASRRNGTLYIGITSDLGGRVWQHKNKVVPGFTAKWQRDWKLALIERDSPAWRDLYDTIAT